MPTRSPTQQTMTMNAVAIDDAAAPQPPWHSGAPCAGQTRPCRVLDAALARLQHLLLQQQRCYLLQGPHTGQSPDGLLQAGGSPAGAASASPALPGGGCHSARTTAAGEERSTPLHSLSSQDNCTGACFNGSTPPDFYDEPNIVWIPVLLGRKDTHVNVIGWNSTSHGVSVLSSTSIRCR